MKNELIKHNWYFEGSDINLRPGDIYFLSLGGRVVQAGIIDSIGEGIIKGIEGNTSIDGGFGKGVYVKTRSLADIKGFGKIN